jgi:hypothetical protein
VKKEQTKTSVVVPSTSINRRQLLTTVAPLGVAAVALSSQVTEASAASIEHAGIVTSPGAGAQTQPSAIAEPHMSGAHTDILASAMWVQGNALTVENLSAVANTVHIGWGTVVYGNFGKSSWFHIPIPSPVIINNQRPFLTRVFLMFNIGPGMGYISNVHLYDGAYNFKQFNQLYLTGDHRTYLDGANTFILDVSQTIYLALGISFAFQFSSCIDGGCSAPWFTISSAGGDFHL